MAEAGGCLGGVGQGGGSAHLFADRGCHLWNSRLVDVDDALEEVDAFLPRGLRIGVERGNGRCDGRRLTSVGIAERDLADRLFRGGVDHVETFARQRLDPLAVDVELGAVTHLVLPRSFECIGATYAKLASLRKYMRDPS